MPPKRNKSQRSKKEPNYPSTSTSQPSTSTSNSNKRKLSNQQQPESLKKFKRLNSVWGPVMLFATKSSKFGWKGS